MSITVIQQAYKKQSSPSALTTFVAPVYTPAVFVVESTQSGQINYRFIADIYINGLLKTRLKFSPNSASKGIVDVSNILIDFSNAQILGYDSGAVSGSSKKANVSSNLVPHSIHQIDKFSRNENVMIDWEVKFGEEYQLTSASNPIIYDGKGVAGNPFVTGGFYQSWNSTLWQFDSLMYDFASYSNYILDAGSKQLMTKLNSTTKRKVRLDDYHTFAMFNGTDRNNEQSRPDRMNVRTYDESGTQLQFFQVTNTDVNGGSPYSSSQDNGTENFLFVGAGPKNFENQGNTISASATYYTIQFVQGGAGKSTTYTFEIDNCNDSTETFKSYRLAWLNSLGGYDYYNFEMKNESSFDFERQTYQKTIGTWQQASYFFQQSERGTTDFNVNSRQKLRLNSDWIIDEEVEMMKELFMSPAVFMLEDENVFPVNVQSTNFIEYKQKEDKVFQYELEVSFSNKYKVQNG